MLLSTMLFAVSLSIDACAVAASYSIRGIKIPVLSRMIICVFSFVFASVSLSLGAYICQLVPVQLAQWIGFGILFALGFNTLCKGLFGRKKPEKPPQRIEKEEKRLLNIVIKSLGITICIVKDPTLCDMDNSNVIDIKESVLLSLALSVDCFAAAIGVAAIGITSIWFSVMVAISQLIFLSFGVFFGRKLSKSVPEKVLTVISGVTLIAVALTRLEIFYR